MVEGVDRDGATWNVDALRRLFDDLRGTDIDELEVVRGSFRLFLRREPGTTVVVEDRIPVPEAPTAGVAIPAPLTGVFYGRPTPEQPAFVEIGQWVEQGQVVGLIETMKLFNEVVADLSGQMVEVCAEDGDLVEVGQALFRLLPGSMDPSPATDIIVE